MVEWVPDRDMPSSQRCEPGSVNIRPSPWPVTMQTTGADPDAVVDAIISSLNQALTGKDYDAAASLFAEDGYWRDHLGLCWELRTVKGRHGIATYLQEKCGQVGMAVDRSSAWRRPQHAVFSTESSVHGLQSYLCLTTGLGSGRGLIRLVEKSDGWMIWTLYTVLDTIKGHEEAVGPNRSLGVEHGGKPGRKNWFDRRREETDFVDREPDVLIIGAGQAGLTAHARLKMVGVSALIIERNEAVGDNWRKRYHQLVLHDPVWYDHLPYCPFPDNWPVFTPKDKLGDWFQSYASTMELNVWTRTELQSSSWDDGSATWTVTVRRVRPDGETETRTLRPRHVVQATGHSGKPHMPNIAGMSDFCGRVLCHSSDFAGASEGAPGRKAVVVGACNSSHDICQDYHEKGWEVTMVQRSSTCVLTSRSIITIYLAGLYEEDGPPTEDADMALWSWPSEVFKTVQRELTRKQLAADAPTLDGLRRAGFQLDSGPDDAGLFVKYLQRGGGYYFDVGASPLIADGRIRLRQGRAVAEILPHGLVLQGGEVLEADELVFATGYENMRTDTRRLLGDDVADRVGDVWGFDHEGEMRALWRDSGHPGFWYHGGNLALCRYYSKLLALQIKARLEGL